MTEIDVYKTNQFQDFAQKVGLADEKLVSAAKKAEGGLVYANLRGNLIKLSIPHGGKGSKKAIRAICAYKKGVVYIYLTGFSKSKKNDLTKAEVTLYKMAGKNLLANYPLELRKAVSNRTLIEVATKVETND